MEWRTEATMASITSRGTDGSFVSCRKIMSSASASASSGRCDAAQQ